MLPSLAEVREVWPELPHAWLEFGQIHLHGWKIAMMSGGGVKADYSTSPFTPKPPDPAPHCTKCGFYHYGGDRECETCRRAAEYYRKCTEIQKALEAKS